MPPNKQASTPKYSPVTRSAPDTVPPQPVAVPTTEPSCTKPDIAPAEPSTATSKMANSSTTTTQVESSACDYPLPSALSAFSGLGSMDLGLEAAGYRLVGAIELDELARSSLRANREGRWPIIREDIAGAALHLRPEDLSF